MNLPVQVMRLTLGTATFMVEMLMGDLIFLFSAKKRPHFGLRLVLTFVVCGLIAYLFPFPEQIFDSMPGTLAKNLLLIGLTIPAMGACFDLSGGAAGKGTWLERNRPAFRPLFSACISGYAVQHIAFQCYMLINHIPSIRDFTNTSGMAMTLTQIPVFILVYGAFLVSLGRFVAEHNCIEMVDKRFVGLAFVIIAIGIGLRRVTQIYGEWESVTISLYAIVSCLLTLVIQYVLFLDVELRFENDTIQMLLQEERKQYQLSADNVEQLNIKYHDLKFKLAGFRGRLPDSEIEDMEAALRVYEGNYHTGSEALDVLLFQNSLRCAKEGITLNFTGSGAALAFMEVTDLYSLFGNAIENAVEAVLKLEDKEKRLIDVFTERKGEMVMADIANYYDGELALADGMPVTGKRGEEGYHGFGVKSMKLIVEKYGGELSIDADGEIFHLRFYLLNPSAED